MYSIYYPSVVNLQSRFAPETQALPKGFLGTRNPDITPIRSRLSGFLFGDEVGERKNNFSRGGRYINKNCCFYATTVTPAFFHPYWSKITRPPKKYPDIKFFVFLFLQSR